MDNNQEKLKEIWNQRQIPVILWRTGKGEKVRLRLPYTKNNRDWLKADRRINPEWCEKPLKCWEIPKSWFNDVVERSLDRWGKTYIIQPYRESQICTPSCRNAQGHDCECSCMGLNHGMGDEKAKEDGWFMTSDGFAVMWGNKMLASRLLIRKPGSHHRPRHLHV